MKTVVIGMSGGVDSSVAALILKEQGYQVIGLFMKNWEEEKCSAEDDFKDVVCVCDQLKIPCYPVNFSQSYWDNVFSSCLKNYAIGDTPNPDVLCNREIKFKIFLDKAIEIGADFLATGHYCRREMINQEWCLIRGADQEKDQSYFLYTLKTSLLEKILFPIGEMKKNIVRKYAESAGLVTAQKPDSQGICFIGKRNFKKFLSNFIPSQRGNLERLNGTVVGQHDGIAFYTIGQRRGLNIGGKGKAWYVVGKDPSRNVIFVEQGENHPTLYRTKLTIHDLNWVGSPPSLPLYCTAKVRYRSPDTPCTVFDGNQVVFDQPQKAVTPGQSIVFYQGHICLGGGIINSF
ncbi:MAG: tRNA 2-thiouridine(34) synthase MnmA [Chlamydiales bacterium]